MCVCVGGGGIVLSLSEEHTSFAADKSALAALTTSGWLPGRLAVWVWVMLAWRSEAPSGGGGRGGGLSSHVVSSVGCSQWISGQLSTTARNHARANSMAADLLIVYELVSECVNIAVQVP